MGYLIDTFQDTGTGPDFDPDIAASGRGYHWSKYTGPNTLYNPKGVRGRFPQDGERWRLCLATRPYSSSFAAGRAHNWHQVAVSGFQTNLTVSSLATDIYDPASAGHETTGGSREVTIEYTGACSGASGHTHFLLPLAYDQWNYVYYDILFKNDCTGAFAAWVCNASRGPTLGPAINLTNVRTLTAPTFWPGAEFWIGWYISNNFPSGAQVKIDHTADRWGSTWDAAWHEVPVLVSTSNHSNSAVRSQLASLDIDSWIIPASIASQITGLPTSQGGTGTTTTPPPPTTAKVFVADSFNIVAGAPPPPPPPPVSSGLPTTNAGPWTDPIQVLMGAPTPPPPAIPTVNTGPWTTAVFVDATQIIITPGAVTFARALPYRDPTVLTRDELLDRYLGMLPPFYDRDSVMAQALYALGREMERLDSYLKALAAQGFPQNADDAFGLLAMWERVLGIPKPPASATVAQRRAVVLAQLRRRHSSSETDWRNRIVDVLGSTPWTYAEGPGYQITITIPLDRTTYTGVQLYNLIRQITPAHLDIVIADPAGFRVDISQVGVDVL